MPDYDGSAGELEPRAPVRDDRPNRSERLRNVRKQRDRPLDRLGTEAEVVLVEDSDELGDAPCLRLGAREAELTVPRHCVEKLRERADGAEVERVLVGDLDARQLLDEAGVEIDRPLGDGRLAGNGWSNKWGK